MEILSDFYSDHQLASSFFAVQKMVYPHLNLEWANGQNLLRPKVTPFGVFDEKGNAVSILNASHMKMQIHGEKFRTIQIGTVATLPEYRGKGLAGKLQRHVQDKFSQLVDFTFLFANSSVLDFYPKYGFQGLQQTSFQYRPKNTERMSFSQLELDKVGINFLKHLLANRVSISNTIDVCDSEWLAEFYCQKFFSNDLWVDDNRETILVCSIDGNIMELHDIITTKLDEDFFQKFSWNGINEVQLGFTPDRFKGNFESKILPDKEKIFICGKFPKIQTTFKFPALAQT